jgi:hypothetical protein
MHKLTADHLAKALSGDLIRQMCKGGTQKTHGCCYAEAISRHDNWEDFVDKAQGVYAQGEFMGLPPEVSVMFMGLHIGYAAALIQFGLEGAVLSENDETKAN